MTAAISVVPFDSMMKDLYPLPGTRLKQWVVDARREAVWVRETCPLVLVPAHDDNCGDRCRNVGVTAWAHLNHDSCHECNDLQEGVSREPEIVAWCADLAARPKSTSDLELLSDEVQQP